MKIGLNLLERVCILQILPIESDFLTLKIVHDIVAQVGITDEEFIEFGIKEVKVMKCRDCGKESLIPEAKKQKFWFCPGCGSKEGAEINHFGWNDKGKEPKEFEFGDKAVEVISNILKGLNDHKKINDQNFELFQKFGGEEHT